MGQNERTMATIFHLALASDWAAAQAAGAYAISTRGRTLAEEGFIHASRADQWTGVRDRFYADVTEPLLLLQIDTERLDVPLVEEPPAPGVTETFPHIYGPLRVDAVVKAMLVPTPGTTTTAPAIAVAAAPPPAPAPRPQSTGESFSRVFLSEMFVNMGLTSLILVATVIGLAVGGAFGDEVAPLIGAAIGLALGVAAARVLYVRRHDGR